MSTLHPHRRGSVLLALALAAATSFAALAPASQASTPAPAATVVVSGPAGTSVQALTSAVEQAGGTVRDRLELIGAVTAELPAGARLPSGLTVVADRALQLAGKDKGPGTSGVVSTVRGTLGLGPVAGEGRGVRVAVVDTGVADVADLAGRLTHVDVSRSSGATRDAVGHGTFVAGLVAGDGRGSDGRYAGVAPGATVLDVKVADDRGATSLVAVLTGLQAVADDGHVDVLNLSLSSGSPLPYQIDPLTQALDRLWDRGVVVVVPAGNDGPAAGSVASPGVDPTLLTVGGLATGGTPGRDDDTVAPWSARGPAPQGVLKPDLVAPGVSIVSTLSPGSRAAGAQTRTDLPAGYATGSGTSFATAVVAGAAAVLLGERSLSPDEVKALLTGTAYRGPALGDGAGAGGVDLAAALGARTPKLAKAADRSAPGSAKTWGPLLDALDRRDQAAAQRAWDGLGKKEQSWAASLWAARSPEADRWSASMWAGLGWDGDAASAQAWSGRIWAASNWAASSWAASNWAASSWAASSWAASSWAASSWAASSWGASSWGASSWAASSWAASSWAASSWAAVDWS